MNLYLAICATTSSFVGVLVDNIGWKWAVVIILIMTMALDYICGLLAAWKTKTVSKEKIFVGILKKVGTLIVVFAIWIVDGTIPLIAEHVPFDVEWPEYVFPLIIMVYIGWEMRSILRNAKKLGVPLPNWMNHLLGI